MRPVIRMKLPVRIVCFSNQEPLSIKPLSVFMFPLQKWSLQMFPPFECQFISICVWSWFELKKKPDAVLTFPGMVELVWCHSKGKKKKNGTQVWTPKPWLLSHYSCNSQQRCNDGWCELTENMADVSSSLSCQIERAAEVKRSDSSPLASTIES